MIYSTSWGTMLFCLKRSWIGLYKKFYSVIKHAIVILTLTYATIDKRNYWIKIIFSLVWMFFWNFFEYNIAPASEIL